MGPADTLEVLGITPASDAELAARFVTEAMPLLDALHRRARRLTYCDADAEDLLQDTVLHAYQGFGSFREGTNLSAWLFRILHNRWVSRHRQWVRRPAEVPFEVTDGTPHVPPTGRSAEMEVLDVIPSDDLKVAFAALSDGVRVAMYYVEVEGYTYAETAALMNVPMGTVMSRVSRGRQRMRVALSHMDHGRMEFGQAEQRSA
jgi:RNA polymerase sigma factor (sigma-70 family)